MISQLKGPIFGPYYCSNCRIQQPNAGQLKHNCVFCGNWFSNYEDILIEEDAERFITHVKERELKNESDMH